MSEMMITQMLLRMMHGIEKQGIDTSTWEFRMAPDVYAEFAKDQFFLSPYTIFGRRVCPSENVAPGEVFFSNPDATEEAVQRFRAKVFGYGTTDET